MRSMRMQMRAREKEKFRAALYHAAPSEEYAELKPKKPETIKAGSSLASRILRYRGETPQRMESSQVRKDEFLSVMPSLTPDPSGRSRPPSRLNQEAVVMLSRSYASEPPPLSSQWPDGLDRFSRTLAAPFNAGALFNATNCEFLHPKQALVAENLHWRFQPVS